jgi:CheY-like chemotaxis protein
MNGLEGLKKAQAEMPDAVILDIMLPGLDGFEVCHRLRNDPKTAQIPIVMTSAKGQEVDREMALKVGANRFLSKPVEYEDLIDAVEEVID